MKRFFSLLLALAVLWAAAYAAAEEKSCAVNVTILAEGQPLESNLLIQPDGDRISLTSSLMPGTCISFPRIDTESMQKAADTLKQCLAEGKAAEIIRSSAAEWFAYMQPETRTGVFSGDAFDRASEMQRITFSYGDLMLLEARIRKALAEQGIAAETDGNGFPETMMPERNVRFELKLFDGGKYASLAALDGDNTVMTFSADLSAPDRILAVIGGASGGKNYYCSIRAERTDGRLAVVEKLLADDMKTGYPGLAEDSLICTAESVMEWTAEETRLKEVLTPANGLLPVTFAATFRNRPEGRVFEGTLSFSGYDGITAQIVADIQKGGTIDPPSKVIQMEQATEQELVSLGTEIGISMVPAIIRIFNALPEGYSTLLRKLTGF